MSYPESVIQGVNYRLGKKKTNGLLSAGPLVFLTLCAIGDPSSTKMRLDFVIMLHSDDYISLFVSFIDIPVSLGSLFQRIASIYD